MISLNGLLINYFSGKILMQIGFFPEYYKTHNPKFEFIGWITDPITKFLFDKFRMSSQWFAFIFLSIVIYFVFLRRMMNVEEKVGLITKFKLYSQALKEKGIIYLFWFYFVLFVWIDTLIGSIISQILLNKTGHL